MSSLAISSMQATPLFPAAMASAFPKTSGGKVAHKSRTRRLQLVHTCGRISSQPFQYRRQHTSWSHFSAAAKLQCASVSRITSSSVSRRCRSAGLSRETLPWPASTWFLRPAYSFTRGRYAAHDASESLRVSGAGVTAEGDAFPSLTGLPTRICAKLCKTSGRLLRVAVEAIRENEESRSPQSDEDSKSLRVRLSLGELSASEKPNGDGTDDGRESKDEAKLAEDFELCGFHCRWMCRKKVRHDLRSRRRFFRMARAIGFRFELPLCVPVRSSNP